MILQDASPEERAAFLRMLPLAVRLLHKLVGAGIHRRAKARRHQKGRVP